MSNPTSPLHNNVNNVGSSITQRSIVARKNDAHCVVVQHITEKDVPLVRIAALVLIVEENIMSSTEDVLPINLNLK